MVVGRPYFTDDAAALAADAVLYAGGLPAGQQATLTLFAEWFKRTFYRVEEVREAKRQVEFDFGQRRSSITMPSSMNCWRSCLPITCLQRQHTLITT